MTLKPRLIFGIAFWVLFLLSLAFFDRYRWVDRIWSSALWASLVATAIYSISQTIRNRGNRRTNRYPPWFLRFAYDDDDPEGRREKPVSCLPPEDAI